jgi:hypothetical protein
LYLSHQRCLFSNYPRWDGDRKAWRTLISFAHFMCL